MKLISSVIICSLLSGCSLTLAPKPSFPEAPASLLEPCDNLEQIPPTTELSQVADVVVDNYTQYHVCQEKDNSWIDWYWQQKSNLQKVK